MKTPSVGSIQARVLELFKSGRGTLNDGRAVLGLAEKQFRSAVDKLREKGWTIENCAPFEWRLLTVSQVPNR